MMALSGFGGGFGREGAVLRNHQRDHGAAFGRRADVEHLDEARGAFQAMRNLDRFRVGRGLVEIGLLAGGEEIGRRSLGAGRKRRGGFGGRRLEGGVGRDGVLCGGEEGKAKEQGEAGRHKLNCRTAVGARVSGSGGLRPLDEPQKVDSVYGRLRLDAFAPLPRGQSVDVIAWPARQHDHLNIRRDLLKQTS